MDKRLWIITAALLGGCATVPLPKSDKPLAALTPADAIAQNRPGATVRWGGVIVEARPGKGETCFEVSSRPLDSEGEPLDSDQTYGRFIACAQGFHDPSVYAPQRELTVVGTLVAPVTGKIGEHEYRYPALKADALQLWPLPQYLPYRYYDPYWDYPYRPRFWYRW